VTVNMRTPLSPPTAHLYDERNGALSDTPRDVSTNPA